MTDMIVNLHSELLEEKLEQKGVIIRRVVPPEKHVVLEWVGKHFSEKWVSECDVACSVTPADCFIAVKDKELLGFACIDTTFRNFFGPTGVKEEERGQGIGQQLLIHSLKEMKNKGYAYAIIGDAGPVGFYRAKVGAVPIENKPALQYIEYLD
ncbi:GNAT family N-acetyltransferase [Gracilibacillus alcaliphilus]|uniref:GNAT family N-acetyltransferase n=1 Tax=Gracilibacillus alcaliphilus TaxID=1401441 RepID=UPI00195B467D|nr:GNAT family N-acetyltransferase [Gracilibacillus alcaliphilus]MBM7675521.1 GNAT superfamily N-acetyltransferase [Gracilibacillus alcaliphilus]